MPLPVLLLVGDATLRGALADEVTSAGGVVVAREEDARAAVVDADEDGVEQRILAATRDRRMEVLGLAAPSSLARLDGCTEVALKPLRPGEIALRLARLARRQQTGAERRAELLTIAVESSGDVVEITNADHASLPV